MIQAYIKKIAKDTGWVLILNSINYASSFVIAVLVSRFMGVEQLGIYAYIAAASSVIYLVSDFGLTTLLVRKIGEYKSSILKLIGDVNIIKITLAAFITLVLFIISVLFKIQNTGIALWLGIASVFPKLIQTSFESSIRVSGMQKYPTLIRSINSFLQIVFSLYFILLGYGLVGIFTVILVFEIVTAIVFELTNKWILKKSSLQETKESYVHSYKELMGLFKESSPFFTFNFLRFSSPAINIFLLEYISSIESVGIYSAASRFVSGIGLFSGAVYNSYYPFIANLASETRIKYELTRKLFIYASVFGILITSLTFVLSSTLIDLTFKIDEAKTILRILSFMILPWVIFPVLESYLFSSHYEKFMLKIFSSAWLLNLLLTFVLIKFYSYNGLAVSVLIIEYILLLILSIKFKLIKKTIV